MSRMKKFFKYLLIFGIVYFLVNFLSFHLMKSTYKKKEFTSAEGSPQITISESKATITNGYLNGTVTNDTEENLEGKCLQLDFYSPRGINVGTKYIRLKNLAPGESTDIVSKYNFDNVDHVSGTIVDEAQLKQASAGKLLDFEIDDIVNDKTNWFYALMALIFIFG